MPLDPSIYSQLDTRGIDLGGMLAEQQDRQSKLAQLAMQQRAADQQSQLTGQQIRAGQRTEAAYPAQQAEVQRAQKEKNMQELSSALAFGIQQKNGISNQQLMDSTYQEAMRRGLNDQDVATLLQPWASVGNQTDGVVVEPTAMEQQGVADTYAKRANPQEAIKQQLESINRSAKPAAPSALANLMAERDQIAAANPDDPRLATYKQMIEKVTTQAPQTQIVVGEGGAMSAVTMPKTPGQKPTVTPLGVTKPMAAGNGGAMTAAQEAKFRESWSKDYKELSGALSTAREIASASKKVKESKGLEGITGLTGYLPSRPGSDASRAMADFETLKGKVTAMGKAVMASTGAMGTMANQEWKIVSDAIAAIDPTKMDAGKLRDQIELIEQQAIGMNERLTDAYERQYGSYYEKFPEFKLKPAQPNARQPSAQDNEAVTWARSNPNDPRSAAILQSNGVQ